MAPGGLWDSSKYEIKAMVKRDGKIIDTIPMNFARTSTFRAKAEVTGKGKYEIIVFAFDPQTGNSGVDRQMVAVR